jgi:hypothetical protein
MVKMEICFDSEDRQISKLSKSFLIAYRIRKVGRGVRLGLRKFKSNKPSSGDSGNVKAFFLASKEVLSATNGSSDSPEQGSYEALAVPSTLLPESLPNKKGKNIGQALVDPAAPSKLERC